MTEENKRKKEYLCKYAEAKKAVKRYDLQIEELRANQIMPCGGMSDMPKAHNKTDLSDYAAQLDEYEQKYWNARYQRIKLYTSISEAIENMENENEKLLLTYCYIKGMSLDEVADEMNYSRRNITNIHGRALSNITLPSFAI